MSKRNPHSYKQARWHIEAKKRGVCERCGARCLRLETHHIVPVRDGGTCRRENLIVCCRRCHVDLDIETARRYPRGNALSSVLGQARRLHGSTAAAA